MRLFGMLVLVVVVAQSGPEVVAAPAKVVDMSVAANQPNFKVVENKITGNDPLSVAASAYVTQRGRVAMISLQNSMKMFKAMNGKPPTFKEFQEMMKQHNVELSVLPPKRLYGYDPKTGGIVILEDTGG
ncbi:MAG TPA: hypothetical protein DEB70_10490 [Planctomycetaceae bacterium]|nr:hypothetical protein [Planctomycetaceae bacterium]|tara:strand:+ start:59 stop:445 length:387 start_codon:yes stop_codon:yes gene_type:complete